MSVVKLPVRRFALLAVLFGVVALLHCSKPRFPAEREQASGKGAYELAWIEPQIVLSDSLFTLIIAQRIDSIPQEQPVPEVAPAVVFWVSRLHCFTAVNLLNENGTLMTPLLAQYLSAGYYKLTLNEAWLAEKGGLGRHYFLKVHTCDTAFTQPVAVRDRRKK